MKNENIKDTSFEDKHQLEFINFQNLNPKFSKEETIHFNAKSKKNNLDNKIKIKNYDDFSKLNKADQNCDIKILNNMLYRLENILNLTKEK